MELEMYPRYQGHSLKAQMALTIVGKLVGTNPKRGSLMLETSHDSKTQVEVQVEEGEEVGDFQVGCVYEVRGVGRSSREMEMRGFTCFGSEFDLVSYNTMLELALNKDYRDIFGYPS